MPVTHELKTIGHATLLLLEDGVPVVATDPWLLGSTYWRSWWLERDPTDDEVEMVRRARALYITHSHPDHFHWPSLRHLGPRPILNPKFPDYSVPGFLSANGYPATILEPWSWYEVTGTTRMASIPVPVDDSVLVVDTPTATVVNVNDANPRSALLGEVRRRMCTPGKPVILLKSYSPASLAVSIYREGQRVPLKSKRDYAEVVQRMAATLDASHFVPFASQAYFNRTDSRWANEYKVRYEDLQANWHRDKPVLCPPFVTLDLGTFEWSSPHSGARPALDGQPLAKVEKREADEAEFELPDDFDVRLEAYLRRVWFLRTGFRKGIGWRLANSGKERFYDTRTRRVLHCIPEAHDFVVTLPDKVLYEALGNNVLTDLGITMFTRVDTTIDPRRAYLAFLLMGLHDYGHFGSVVSLARFLFFYVPYVFPAIIRGRHRRTPSRPLEAGAMVGPPMPAPG